MTNYRGPDPNASFRALPMMQHQCRAGLGSSETWIDLRCRLADRPRPPLLLSYDNDRSCPVSAWRCTSAVALGPVTMTCDGPATDVSAELRQARRELMGGRGPGAGDAEVAAHTRDRVMIGRETATRRLEMAARQTGYARRDAAAITRTAQLTGGELAETVAELARRLHPRRLRSVSGKAIRRQLGAHPTPFVVGVGVALLVVIRRLLR